MMTKNGLVAVIFDLGDTLVRLNPPASDAEYDELYTRVQQALLTRFPDEAANISAELLRNVGGRVGQLLAHSYAADVPDRLRERDAVALFRQVLAQFAPDLQPSDGLLRFLIAAEEQAIYRPQLAAGTLETLEELRQRGLRLGLCSNYFGLPEAARANVYRLGLLERLDQTVFSCEVGWRKPDPAIYQAICRKLAVRPSECLFVGDRLREDVRGPQQLGMRTAIVQHFRREPLDNTVAHPDHTLTSISQVLEAF